MTKLPYLRTKKAKGRTYYYFDAGKSSDGQRVLIKLPDIRDPGFGGSYARAKATRTNREKRKGTLALDGLIRSYESSPEFRQLSESSKRNYSRYLARANQLMRDSKGESWPASAVEKKDIIRVRELLSDTPGAANQVIRAMGALFAWAIENDKAAANPASGIKKFKATPHERWPDELLEEALSDPQIGLAVALFYFTGQRINEVVKMSWRDVGPDYVRVYVQKTRRHLEVAMIPELAERLRNAPRGTLTIIANANGQPWTQSGLRQKLQAWAKGHGHKVVPHGLRKNAVISLLKAGCTAAEVHGITDQSIQMIEHYARGMEGLPLGRAAVIKLDVARKARNNA